MSGRRQVALVAASVVKSGMSRYGPSSSIVSLLSDPYSQQCLKQTCGCTQQDPIERRRRQRRSVLHWLGFGWVCAGFRVAFRKSSSELRNVYSEIIFDDLAHDACTTSRPLTSSTATCRSARSECHYACRCGPTVCAAAADG